VRLRRSLQGLSLVAFFALFFTATYRLTGMVPHDLFLRADPLAALLILLTVPAAISAFAVSLAVVVSAVASAVQYFLKFWSQVDDRVKQRRRRLLILERQKKQQDVPTT